MDFNEFILVRKSPGWKVPSHEEMLSLYFIVPLIYRITFDPAKLKFRVIFSEVLSEIIAYAHISKFSTKHKFRFGYLSTSKGGVDFSNGGNWATKVKLSNNQNLSRAYKDQIIPDKMIWGKYNLLIEWPRGIDG